MTQKARTRVRRSVVAVTLLAVAALLAAGSSRSSRSTAPAANIPRVRCDAPPGVYPATPSGTWVALVKNARGDIVSYGIVGVSEMNGRVSLVGRNYRRDGSLKYTWHGKGSWNGQRLVYVWKIHGANPGLNNMTLSHGNARLSGYWVRKGARGSEYFCRKE